MHPSHTPPSHSQPSHSSAARDAICAALTPPPQESIEHDRLLLALASEAGIGGHALSLLERIDVTSLSAHDRITYLRHVTACAAWFEAFQTIATAAVAGPTAGWPELEVDERVNAELAEARADSLPEPERLSVAAQVRDEAWEVRERAIQLEVSLATRVSTRTAGRRIDAARLLVESLPRAIDEAWEGRWGYGHLRVAEKELLDVPAPLREQVLNDVVPYAATDHPRRLSERMRKSLAKRDAMGMAARTRERAQERDVSVWSLKDGQARLAITGPYEVVHQAARQLTELGHAMKAAQRERDPEVPCSLGAARFDAAIAGVARLHASLRQPVATTSEGIASGNLADADPSVHSDPGNASGNLADADPSIHSNPGNASGNLAEADPWAIPPAGTPGSRPRRQASIIIDASTALHLAEEPGFVPGYGWVPAPIAREILADAQEWRRWLLDDSTRQILDTGTVRYRPSEALRELIAGRDVTCTADTCTRPASEAQVDHAIDFDGSNTSAHNLHVVCGPDHLAITAGHFVIDTGEDGRPLWVSTGSGHAYPSYVEPLHDRPPVLDG